MRRRNYIKLAGTACIAPMAGCAGDDGGDGGNGDGGTGDGGTTTTPDGPGGGSDPITIAAIEPQSGPFAPWATVHLQGLQIAVEELNAGDTLDREVQLVTTDTGADPAAADSAFRRHVEQDGAVAVAGANSSDVGIRTAQTAEELEIPNFLHMAGSSAILSSDTRYTFRVGWLPAPSHVRADVEFIQNRGATSVGAIVADYAWGRNVQEEMESLLPEDIDLQIEVAPVGADDFTSYLRQFPNDVELLDFVGHPPGAFTAAAQTFELDIDATILGVDAPPLALFDILGENVTNDVYTRHLAVPGTDGYNSLGQRVAEEFDQPMYFYQLISYMTGMMIGEAVAEVGADPTGIADYVRSNSFDMLYENPLEYTEWGEFKDPVLLYSQFVEGAPDFYPDASYDVEVVAKSGEIPAPEPES